MFNVSEYLNIVFQSEANISGDLENIDQKLVIVI